MEGENQLISLRLQNEALLNQLKHGQQSCHDIINKLFIKPKSNSLARTKLYSCVTHNNLDDRPLSINVNESENSAHGKKLSYKPLAQGLDVEVNASVGLQQETSKATSSYEPSNLTPKSILKRRKLIDDNVKVQSKYNHTPVLVSRHNDLNFSYSEIDDLEPSWNGNESNSVNYFEKTNDSDLDGSYTEEIKKNRKTTKKRNKKVMVKDCESSTDKVNEIENLVRDRLLLDSGNDRKNVKIVEALMHRPKSVLFEEESKVSKQQKNKAVKTREDLNKNITKEMAQLLEGRQADEPLLGYDWIAGVLDNGPILDDKSDDYFDSIKEFRRVNKEECIGQKSLQNILDLSKPVSPAVKNPNHTCLHGFIVNERLFPEAMNSDEEGNSVCPICLSVRPEPTEVDPGFVRISVPRSTLMSPYRVQPHRRCSFDSSDAISLSNHCIAGYECSRPAMLPTASALDIKHTVNGVKGQLFTTESELDKLIQGYSLTNRTLSDSHTYTSESENRELKDRMRQNTDDLLNTSHSLRFELQKMEKEKKIGKPEAFSTAYPAF